MVSAFSPLISQVPPLVLNERKSKVSLHQSSYKYLTALPAFELQRRKTFYDAVRDDLSSGPLKFANGNVGRSVGKNGW